MTFTPPMTFRAEDIIHNQRMAIDGPIVAFWGQNHEEHYRRGELGYGDRPRRRIIDRLRRARTWRFAIRVAPPKGLPLKEHSQDVARILGLPYGGDPEDGDLATWIPGSCKAKTAADALAVAGRVLQTLGKLDCGAVQIKVEEWPAPSDQTGADR